MLVDANLLLFATDKASPFHIKARDWLTQQLRGEQRVGLPWQSLCAFVHITTHAGLSREALAPTTAWRQVQEWLASDLVWIPAPTDRHAEVLGNLIERYQLRGNLITDAQLAALTIEHGQELCSADTDFARFTEIRWVNPLAA